MSETSIVARRSLSFQDISQASLSSVVHRTKTWLLTVGANLTECPPWWSKNRDEWLVDFWKLEGNDLLAGAISTLVSKITSTDWYLEGPIELAQMYRNIFLHQSEFGHGWDEWVSKWVSSYLSRDMGGLSERQRLSITDHTGPALGFAHLDESRCYMTGDPTYPVMYMGEDKTRKIHRSQVMRIVDMPSGRDSDMGYGMCATSRAVATAAILRDVVRYKRERLSDLPPAGIMFINNLSEAQWQDIMEKYDSRQRNEGNKVWRDILTAFGYDPEYPVGAELFELSQLPEHYDEKTATDIAIYTFALAFRVDPREYWPVTQGALGTATEAEIQHKKAKAKGEGIIFNAIEHQLNSPLSIPQELTFRFDYRDDEEDMMAAQIDSQKISNIRKMWEASPAISGRPNSEDEELPASSEYEMQAGGMITTEEARMMLARERLIPAEFVSGLHIGDERLYDIRSWGPWGRVTKSGEIWTFGGK